MPTAQLVVPLLCFRSEYLRASLVLLSISARLRSSEANNRAHPPTTPRSATTMKTKAAVLWGLNQKWEVEEVDLDGPKEAEVLVKLTASGLCHSDHHLVTGDLQMPLPAVGGHEGAGVVVEVGPGVTEV